MIDGRNRVAPALRGRPREVLAYIDDIGADELRSWLLHCPALSDGLRLRLLRADAHDATVMVTELTDIYGRLALLERGRQNG